MTLLELAEQYIQEIQNESHQKEDKQVKPMQQPVENNILPFDFDPYVAGCLPNSIYEYKAYSETANIYLCEYCMFNQNGKCKRGTLLPEKWQRCKSYQFSGKYRKV